MGCPMSSLADLPELVGFFSYSRSDDERAAGALSALRKGISNELGSLLGHDVRLWQDKAAIPHGTLWADEIRGAIAESSFFIPIVTPSAVASVHCRNEFEWFLAREAELGRKDLIFPLLYIRVHGLGIEDQRRQNDVLETIHARQYADWTKIRHHDLTSIDVRKQIEGFCQDIVNSLLKKWVTPEERRRDEEAAAQRKAEEERQRLEAETKRRDDEEVRRKKAEAEQQRLEAETAKLAADAKERAADELRQQEAERGKKEREGRVLVNAAIVNNVNNKWFLPGAGRAEWFKDHEAGPEMVVVPAGMFIVGSPDTEPQRDSVRESPRREVTIAQPFAVARHAITRGQFAAFVTATGHAIGEGALVWKGDERVHDPKASWRAPGFFQDDGHPVVCINPSISRFTFMRRI
jgi:hypothetical protein